MYAIWNVTLGRWVKITTHRQEFDSLDKAQEFVDILMTDYGAETPKCEFEIRKLSAW